MIIKKWKLQDIIPSDYNPRIISDEELKKLNDSMEKFGYIEPIIVNKRNNHIIGGHQRYKILCKKFKETDEIEVVETDLDELQEKTLNIALNKISGEFDDEALSILLKELQDTDKDLLKYTGFDLVDVEQYLRDLPHELLDDEPEDPEKITTEIKNGDLIQLGKHFLLCGNSEKKEDVEKLVNGNKCDMIFTDPPYSVNYEKKTKEIFKNNSYNVIQNDELSVEDISINIWKPAFKNMFDVAKDECSFYMTMPQGGDQMMMMMKENWKVKHELIWVKPSAAFSMNRLDYDYQHEPIMYGWKKKHNWYGKGKYTKSVWNIGRDTDKLHPTMKPIELITNAIENSSKTNDIVLDPFLGSGSTLIACEQTNRICYGLEIDPHYCEVICQRWEKLTNQKRVCLIKN
jgi:DNA modification methylase